MLQAGSAEYCTDLTVLCLDQHNYGVMISSSRMNNNLAGDSLCLCVYYTAVRLLLGGTVVSGFLSTSPPSTGSRY